MGERQEVAWTARASLSQGSSNATWGSQSPPTDPACLGWWVLAQCGASGATAPPFPSRKHLRSFQEELCGSVAVSPRPRLTSPEDLVK